jgi:glycosyltransferase involved in cell wall biosynthesis
MNRVLFLIKGLGRGGAEQLLANSVRHLDRSRFEFEVAYLLPAKAALVPVFEEAGMPVHCLAGKTSWDWVRLLRKVVRSRRIDLVHVHSPFAAIGARLGLPRDVQLVYTEHNVWDRYHRATYWANVLTYPRNDHVFTVADSVLRSIRYPRGMRWRSMPPTEVLYQGLDLEDATGWDLASDVRTELGIAPGAPVVGTVANFKPHKGHHELLEAAAEVKHAIPDVRFVFVGVGPLEDQVRVDAERLGLGETVVFAGFREDVPRVMAAFDVFTLASRHEGLAIALLEALALGRPVVVTSVGGLPEVVSEGEEGFLVPPGDIHRLADRIVTLIADRSLRERFGNAGRRRAAAFDIRRSVSRSAEIYEELLSLNSCHLGARAKSESP